MYATDPFVKFSRAISFSEFGIIPTTRREGEVTFKGYQRLDFEDAWSRYPLLEPSHGHNADELALSNNADP